MSERRQKQKKENDKRNSEAEWAQAVSRVRELITELEKVASYLPAVEDDGYSECPFAEELYANKEEAQTKLAECLVSLRAMLNAIDQELTRCNGNQARISSDLGRLHLTNF